MDIDEVQRAYDLVAQTYHQRLRNELDAKPFDRAWLDAFADSIASGANVVEVGCGDGHVADYLARRGLAIRGLDLSPAMVEVARHAYHHVEFLVGDVLALPFADGDIDALVSFYSVVNLTPEDCAAAFDEFRRVLRVGGRLTLAFHIGVERMRIENWWDSTASLDFYFHPVERISSQLETARLTVERSARRLPYAVDVEAQTERAYITARAV